MVKHEEARFLEQNCHALEIRRSPKLTKPIEAGGNFTAKLASMHWETVLQALVIVAAGLWIYWPALDGNWFWDDSDWVTDNSNLRSLQGLWQIWFAVPTNNY